MPAHWTQTYAYLAYVMAVVLAVVNWLGELLKNQLYERSADGRLDEHWLEFAHWLAQYLRHFTFTGILLTLLGLLLAAFSAAESAEMAQSHRGFLLRLCAIVLATLCLSYVGHGDLSKYHIDIVAAAACVWALWVGIAGWRALAGGVVVAGPALWWLGLVVILLLVLRLIALLFFVSPDSPHQF